MSLILRLLLLTVIYFVGFSVSSALFIPVPVQTAPTGDSTNLFLALLEVSVLNSLVVAFIILRSRLAGWRLMLQVFLIFFGITTFMAQMETAVFVTDLPQGMLSRIILSWLVFSLLLSVLAVLLLGKRKGSIAQESNYQNPLTTGQWLVRLTLIGIAYVIIYFTFGYYLAWRNPAVRAYYHGTDPGNFLAQFKSVVVDTPWLPLFQFLRGLLWAMIALFIIRMLNERWWITGLAVSLSFAVMMSSQLLLPNPLMPRAVRLAHLVETASSNFLFGWLLVLVLVKWRPSVQGKTATSKT